LAEFKDGQVDCRVEPFLIRGRDRIVRTADGRLDLAIVTHDPLQIRSLASAHSNASPEMEIVLLAKQPFCVAAKRESAPASELESVAIGSSIRLNLLARWDLVGLDRESGIRQKIERHLRAGEGQLRFQTATGVGGWPAAKEHARLGLGVAILPLATLSSEDQRELTLRRLSPRFALEEYLIHRRHAMTAAQEEVIRVLRAAAQNCQRENRCKWRGVI